MRPFKSRFEPILNLAALLLLISQPALGQAERPPGRSSSHKRLTLNEALDLALKRNPRVRAAGWRKTMATASSSQARAGRWPSLQFSETFRHSNNPVFVFGSRLEQSRFGPENFELDSLNDPGSFSDFRSSLDLRIPLFNRFQVAAGIRQAEIGEEVAEAQAEQVEQQIRFDVVRTYYGVLVAEARLKVAGEAVETAEADVKRLRDLHEQGMVVTSTLLAMQVQLAEFRQRQIQEKGEVTKACAELNTTLGGAVDAACDIGGELKERRFPIPSQGQLLGEALQNRPDYRQTEMEMARRQQQIRSARGAYLPDLNLFAQFGHSGQDLNSGSADFTVGASVTFNVLDRGRTARARRAHASWEAARALREERAGQIRLEVVRAYQNFLAAEESLRVASGVIDQAQETLRIVRDRNRVGLTTITEVLRAQTAVVRAQMNLLEARYNYYLGYARSLLVSGQLTSVSSLA